MCRSYAIDVVWCDCGKVLVYLHKAVMREHKAVMYEYRAVMCVGV